MKQPTPTRTRMLKMIHVGKLPTEDITMTIREGYPVLNEFHTSPNRKEYEAYEPAYEKHDQCNTHRTKERPHSLVLFNEVR
jgi:hypothetical protein